MFVLNIFLEHFWENKNRYFFFEIFKKIWNPENLKIRKNRLFKKSCQKSTPRAQKRPRYAPNTFWESLEPIGNFLATFLIFEIFTILLLNSAISSTPENRVFRSESTKKMVKPSQNRMETLPRCPRDTLETHSTLPQRILCRENGILQKTRFCVYFSTFWPRWVPSNPDLDILPCWEYFSVLLILLNYLKGT